MSRCRGVYKRGKCRRCSCAECPVILFRADCAVPTRSFHSFLRATSSRCQRRYIRALKDRRDRLKQLALGHLTAAESEQLGLLGDTVLDVHGPQVVQLLQQRRVRVPAALQVRIRRRAAERDTSVYREVKNPSDAELFFRLGFRDTGAWLNAYCVETWRLELPYILWLDNHGVDAFSARIEPVENGHSVFTAHSTCFTIGRLILVWNVLKGYLWRAGASPNDDWLQRLQTALLRPDLTDDCRCKCSTEGCTPLIYLLKGICYSFGRNSRILVPALSSFFSAFSSHLDMRHHMASLRFLTFQALGIPHTCRGPFPEYQCRARDSDAEELDDDHAYELEVLETLLEEFQSGIMGIVQDPRHGLDGLLDFWENTWHPRVMKIRRNLDGNNLPDVERQRGEEIGVVWDQPASPPAPPKGEYPKGIGLLTRWVQELDEVEAECQ